LAVVVAIALAFRYGGESMWWIEIARYLPFPVYLVPALLLVACAWPLGWRWRALALLAPAIVVTELMGLAWGSPDEGSGHLRFMTYNVKAYVARTRPDGYARLAWEIASQDADVIVMQDANPMSNDAELPDPIRVALKGRTIFRADQYIVASRHPLSGCALGDMSVPDATDHFVHCTLSVGGRDIDLFTAHLVSPREGLNAARGKVQGGVSEWEANFGDRLTESIELAAAVSRSSHPVILAGDLNAEERSPVVRRLLAVGLRDAFSSADTGYGYTLGHDLKPGFSFLRIDHVLVGPDIGVAHCEPGGRAGSQHRPVVCDLLVGR
jgi:endonuclease/exonuclease/phosphatase (EEP) superfamily protein YafD